MSGHFHAVLQSVIACIATWAFGTIIAAALTLSICKKKFGFPSSGFKRMRIVGWAPQRAYPAVATARSDSVIAVAKMFDLWQRPRSKDTGRSRQRRRVLPVGLYTQNVPARRPAPTNFQGALLPIKHYFLGKYYSDSQRFVLNGIALLAGPAVTPLSQSVITFENCYMIRTQCLPVLVREKGVFHPGRESADEILAGQVPGHFFV